MWSRALSSCALFSVPLFYVNSACPDTKPRAEKDERINGYHSATDNVDTVQHVAYSSVFSISPALRVPSPLSPVLGLAYTGKLHCC